MAFHPYLKKALLLPMKMADVVRTQQDIWAIRLISQIMPFSPQHRSFSWLVISMATILLWFPCCRCWRKHRAFSSTVWLWVKATQFVSHYRIADGEQKPGSWLCVWYCEQCCDVQNPQGRFWKFTHLHILCSVRILFCPDGGASVSEQMGMCALSTRLFSRLHDGSHL